MNEIMLRGSDGSRANEGHIGMSCEFSSGAICVKG